MPVIQRKIVCTMVGKRVGSEANLLLQGSRGKAKVGSRGSAPEDLRVYGFLRIFKSIFEGLELVLLHTFC